MLNANFNIYLLSMLEKLKAFKQIVIRYIFMFNTSSAVNIFCLYALALLINIELLKIIIKKLLRKKQKVVVFWVARVEQKSLMLSIRDCLGITYIRNVLIYRIKNTSKLIKQVKIRSSRIIETLFGYMFILETNGIVIVGKPRLKN